MAVRINDGRQLDRDVNRGCEGLPLRVSRNAKTRDLHRCNGNVTGTLGRCSLPKFVSIDAFQTVLPVSYGFRRVCR